MVGVSAFMVLGFSSSTMHRFVHTNMREVLFAM